MKAPSILCPKFLVLDFFSPEDASNRHPCDALSHILVFVQMSTSHWSLFKITALFPNFLPSTCTNPLSWSYFFLTTELSNFLNFMYFLLFSCLSLPLECKLPCTRNYFCLSFTLKYSKYLEQCMPHRVTW